MKIALLFLVVIGMVGCVPEMQHRGMQKPTNHMERCHGKDHHHNARHDHTPRCLAD